MHCQGSNDSLLLAQEAAARLALPSPLAHTGDASGQHCASAACLHCCCRMAARLVLRSAMLCCTENPAASATTPPPRLRCFQ